ncbi:MAG: glycosyl transferase [Opitutae bacterium]|nr:glycosyl transferase [Opitutae bacterium]
MISPGRLLYLLWHKPRAELRQCLADGGPFEQWQTWRGRVAMERAAASLPAAASAGGPPLEIYLLTGRRFWYQTAFCLWSFARHAGRGLAPVILDDGSLTEENRAQLRRLFPATRFCGKPEQEARLHAVLPAGRFPRLHDRWRHYPHIRKLTGPHLGAAGWKLVLDSDLLFFRRPRFILDWLAAPGRPLHAVDIATAYGYATELLNRVAGAPLTARVNVGLTGLNSGELDWERIEHWCDRLIGEAGTHYYLEQALVAMLTAGRPCAIAPEADYVTLPRPPEADECRAVMHHYVAGSKLWYFRHNWRRVLARPVSA